MSSNYPNTREHLVEKAKELLALFKDEHCWARFDMGQDNGGNGVSALAPTAVCWCLEGGIAKVYEISPLSGLEKTPLYKALEAKSECDMGLSYWNDQYGRTFKEVIALIQSVIDGD